MKTLGLEKMTAVAGTLAMSLAAAGIGCSTSSLPRTPDAGSDGHGRDGAADTVAPDPTDGWLVLSLVVSTKVDMLFMVDNSQSMLPMQAKLLANFPAFMDVLKALPSGLPDLHVAVVSSDTGPGKYDLPERHCANRGDGGMFQFQPRGNCASPPLNANQTFLQASNNQQVKNYAGDITDAFTCIAALGDQGCGFEGQLKSIRWALDPVFIPPGNQGFVRPDAMLAVILITNEDDCSLPDNSDLVDPNQTLMSDPLGPLWSFRCNEFGHLCNIGGVLQPPPRGAAANLQACVSNEGPTGRLTKVADEVAFLKRLKSDPNNIVVAAITGPAEPYGIEMIMQGADLEPHPSVTHSCTQNSGEYGDPAVRIQQWVQAFGSNGILQPICAASFAPALMSIADKIGGALGPKCVPGPFTINATTNQPNCRVVDRFGDPSARVDTVLKNCADNGNTPPCWTLEDDAAKCPGAKIPSFNRGAGALPDHGTAITCAPCLPGSAEIGCSP
jgi:hypothetical protein